MNNQTASEDNSENTVRSSIGYIDEAEHIIGNLVQMQEHLTQALPNNPIQTNTINNIRTLRDRVLKTYAKDVNIKLHCAYKHGLSARTGLYDLLAQAISTDNQKLINELTNVISDFNLEFHKIRIDYLRIDPSEVKDINCMQCIEDYMVGKLGNSEVEDSLSEEEFILSVDRSSNLFEKMEDRGNGRISVSDNLTHTSTISN